MKTGHFCILCDITGATKEEIEIHIKSSEHLHNKTIMNRQFEEEKIKEDKDRELLNYLQEIDPL